METQIILTEIYDELTEIKRYIEEVGDYTGVIDQAIELVREKLNKIER